MIRRLVEHEQIDRVGHRDPERQSRPLAARQIGHLAVSGIARKAEPAEHRAHVAAWLVAHRCREFLDHRATRVHNLGEVLGEGRHVHVATTVQLAAEHAELALQHSQQRRLAGPVRPDHADLGAAFDDQAHAFQHRGVSIGVAQRRVNQLYHHT